MNKRLISVIVFLSLILTIQLCVEASPSDPVDLIKGEEGTAKKVIDLLDQGREQAALEKLNGLHEAVIGARAELRGLSFEGKSGKSLTDPFTLPSGTYRVHFTTEGFGAVEVVPLQGGRGDMIFNISRGQATQGASTLYRSSGKKVMVQFSNISQPYELVFEQLG